MGLNITEIIPRREIEMLELKGKIVCVDAFNTLYQFISTIRQQDGTPLMDSRGNITSVYQGIFSRMLNLMSRNIFPCFVFIVGLQGV